MMNVGNPDRAFDFAGIPNRGVGLARLEFIINRMIGVHPRALLEFDTLHAGSAATRSAARWPATPTRLRSTSTSSARASRTIAAAFAPEPVIVRLSDFKSNEYANLIGGRQYEPARGEPDARLPRRLALRRRERSGPASSSSAARSSACASEMGLTNVQVMVPFVRTLEGGRAGGASCWRRTACAAARTASRSS